MREDHTHAPSLISRIIDWCCANVPDDELQDGQLRARFAVVLFVAMAFGMAAIAGVSMLLNHGASALASLGAIAVCFVVLAMLRVTGSTRVLGIVGVGLALAVVVGWGLALGLGYNMAMLPGFTTILGAAYFIGRRAVVITTLIHLAVLACFVGADHAGYLGVSAEETANMRLQYSLATGIFLIATGAFGYIQLQSHRILQRRASRNRARAEQAAQDQRDFIATISHEFRTPLNAILGMNGLLLETRLDNEQSDYSTNTQRAAEMMLGLVNDILEYSQLEAGGMTIEPAPFCLHDVVYDVAELVKTPAHEKGLDVIVDYDSAIPSILRGDAARVRQVLLNLMANAVKFTDTGHLTLTVSSVADDKNLHDLTLTVADSGVGIASDKLGTIFERFARAGQSHTTQGSGLGLTITHALVEAMGGNLSVTSEVGVGSVFRVELTLPAVPDVTSESATGTQLANKHVIVLDPEGRNAPSVGRLMAAASGTSTHVTTPATALTALAEGEVDGRHIHCALVYLRAVDAEAFINALREEQPRGLPVVLVGRSLRKTTRDRLRALGYDKIIQSPVRPSLLISTLRQPRKVGTTLSIRTVREKPQPIDPPSAQDLGRVLLVEDNPINRRVASAMLAREGLRVDYAANGLEAVDMVRTIAYDAVFMDCAMPVMDGYEATREIRALGGTSGKVPIIALTASILPRDRSEALNAGMDDHLSKPLTLDVLRATLATWMPQTQLKAASSE